MTAAKPDLRFAVTITESAYHGGSRYVHFKASAMIAGTERFGKEEGKPGLFSPDSYELPFSTANRALAGLVITAQADNDSMRKAGNEFYSWSVAYERREIELAGAEEIVKTLRTIARGTERMTRELGRPATLAQFATYAARALTSERAPFMRYVGEENDWEGNGGYRSMDPDALNNHIWSECAEWRKRYGVEAIGA